MFSAITASAIGCFRLPFRTRVLTQEITFKMPPQDLSVDLSRMPALPKSGFLMKEVRPWREMSPPSPT